MRKKVLITGASSGIGKGAALRLAEKGFQVFAGVRKKEDLSPWKGIKNAKGVLLDVSSDESVSTAINEIQSELEDAAEVHLVNNAGIAVGGPIEGVPLSRWKEQFEVNVIGLVRVTQALLPFVRASGKGRIVNISSVSGLATAPYLAPYSASKFAVEAISDGLRREIRQFGCKVIVIEPGPIATAIWEKNLGEKETPLASLSPELRKAYGRELHIFQKGARKSARNAVGIEKVSDVIEEALSSANPRTRYIVGAPGLNLQMTLTSLLPDKLLDGLVAWSFRDRGGT